VTENLLHVTVTATQFMTWNLSRTSTERTSCQNTSIS